MTAHVLEKHFVIFIYFVKNAIFTPRNDILLRYLTEHDWASFELVFRSKWVDFVVKKPHLYLSFEHEGQFRNMICLHLI